MATFTNQATLTYSGGTTNSNITTGQLLEVLTASKTAVVSTYRTGRPITYLITLINSGAAALTGLTVSDDLGGYAFNGNTIYPLVYTAGSVRYYQDGVLQTAPAVTAGPPLTITGISVPAGGSTVIAYEAEPTAFAPLGAEDSVVNTVTVTGGGRAGDLHFRHPEQRQHGGQRGGQSGGHRRVLSHPPGSDRDPGRHGADRPDAVHL